MKALAFNSSPRMGKGNTALILNPFLEGLKEAGAEVDLFYVTKLSLSPCRGCFSCWLRTPGQCAQKDDIEWLMPKMREADIVVYASPVYCYGITGPMKNLIDRMVSIASPFMEVVDGRSRHLPAPGEKAHKNVFVSTCGLWDMENFDAPLAHIKALSKDPPGEFAGALLRPHGEALRAMLKMGAPVSDVLEAAREAGRQLAIEGKMSPDTLKTVSRELLPIDLYVKMVNEEFQKVIDRVKGP
ncbi:MAG: flavodoxin family protein [Chloroflexi bacterium]|nr:flavodoxin family protein [Chloroflexota bacterium]